MYHWDMYLDGPSLHPNEASRSDRGTAGDVADADFVTMGKERTDRDDRPLLREGLKASCAIGTRLLCNSQWVGCPRAEARGRSR